MPRAASKNRFDCLRRHAELRRQQPREVGPVERRLQRELRILEANPLELHDRVGNFLRPVFPAALDHADRKAVQRDVEDVAAATFEPGRPCRRAGSGAPRAAPSARPAPERSPRSAPPGRCRSRSTSYSSSDVAEKIFGHAEQPVQWFVETDSLSVSCGPVELILSTSAMAEHSGPMFCFRHAGHVDASGADHIDRILVAQAADLLRRQTGERKHAALPRNKRKVPVHASLGQRPHKQAPHAVDPFAESRGLPVPHAVASCGSDRIVATIAAPWAGGLE